MFIGDSLSIAAVADLIWWRVHDIPIYFLEKSSSPRSRESERKRGVRVALDRSAFGKLESSRPKPRGEQPAGLPRRSEGNRGIEIAICRVLNGDAYCVEEVGAHWELPVSKQDSFGESRN